MSWAFTRVAGPFEFTEGPVWVDGDVLFTDHDRIRRYDPATGECAIAYDDVDGARGLHVGPEGALYVCEETGRRLVRYDGGDRSVVVEMYRGRRFNGVNDLEFDRAGRLWFSDPSYGKPEAELDLDHRSVYRVDEPRGADPNPVRVTCDTAQPNGLLVSVDGGTLFVAESEYGAGNDRELRAYPILADGRLGDAAVLHDFGPHRGIDGMTLDDAGNVVACAGSAESGPGPMLYVFAPDGRVLETHPVPSAPTNCCFGGPDRGEIYVTAHDACLYRAETDRTGYDDPP